MFRWSRREMRHVELARVLHRRLYVSCEGRVFVVGGEIDHGKLARALALPLDRGRPTAAEAPTPQELGIAACDGELNPQRLHSIRGALDRWWKELAAQKPDKRVGLSANRTAREQREIERLSARLAALEIWLAELAAKGMVAGAPYFLDPIAEAELQAAVEARSSHSLPAMVAWQARIVCWLSGICAARRFLSAMVGLHTSHPEAARARLSRDREARDDWDLLPAALAALAACDGSAARLPRRSFQARVQEAPAAQLLREVAALAELMGWPAYDRLLRAVDELPESLGETEYAHLRHLLARGYSLADAVWACEQQFAAWLSGSWLKIHDVRRWSEAFAHAGCPPRAGDLARLVDMIRRPEDLIPVAAWLDWLRTVSPRAFTPRMQSVVWSTFWNLYLPSAQVQGWFKPLAGCLLIPGRSAGDGDAGLLGHIASYRRLAGKERSLPKSLRRVRESLEKQRREREHLRCRLEQNKLSVGGQMRLSHLERGETSSSGRIKPRAAQKAYLLSGIETLQATVRRLAQARCRQYLGATADKLTPQQQVDAAWWIHRMSEAERIRLCAIVAARARHGRQYKRHLAANQDWITRATIHGLDLDAWFAAPTHVEMLAGRRLEVGVASNLHDVLLMGAYFNTCLSPGGVNEMAALTNAYDANKQVVFLFAADADQKQVVARQLIAISDAFRLVGYNCYMSSRYFDKLNYREVLDGMVSYSGRLAARCGLELDTDGTPATIGDHFWYDDGVCEWPASAQEAWQNAFDPGGLRPARSADDDVRVQVSTLLE